MDPDFRLFPKNPQGLTPLSRLARACMGIASVAPVINNQYGDIQAPINGLSLLLSTAGASNYLTVVEAGLDIYSLFKEGFPTLSWHHALRHLPLPTMTNCLRNTAALPSSRTIVKDGPLSNLGMLSTSMTAAVILAKLSSPIATVFMTQGQWRKNILTAETVIGATSLVGGLATLASGKGDELEKFTAIAATVGAGLYTLDKLHKLNAPETNN